MKDRLITLALSAAVTIGIAAPAFAQVSETAGIANDNVIADCMIQNKRCYKRVFKKVAVKKSKKIAVTKPVEKIVRVETEQTVEKPAVVETPAPAVAAVEAPCAAPAVCVEQPVIIDRFEKRHRSLIHLGLFPFSLFGQ